MERMAKNCLQNLCNMVYETSAFLSKKSWLYEDGLVLTALRDISRCNGDWRYRKLLLQYCEDFVRDGRVPFVEPRPLSLDNMNNAKVVLDAYELTGKREYAACVSWFMELYAKHPRIKENNGLWHKVRYPNQIWLDGVYMSWPFLVRCAVHLKDEHMFAKEANLTTEQILSDMDRHFQLIHEYMYDESAHLYYHAYDHSRKSFWCNEKTGCSANFWGRSLGWLGMACVDVLEHLSEEQEERYSILCVLRHLAEGVSQWQDRNSGVWYQLTALPDEPGNYLESSCSAMFTYTILKGVRLGHLPEHYKEVGCLGAKGLMERFIVKKDGRLGVTSVCQVAGLGPEKCPKRDGTVAYYLSEPVVDNDKKGYGAMLAALHEYVLMLENK